MDEVTEVQSLQDACRLCLSTEEAKSSIFGVPDSTVSLADKIHNCLSIQVLNSDRISTLICSTCIKNVDQWHVYKESCLRSQEKLQQWLSKQAPCSQTAIHIKEEPVDMDYHENITEIVSEVDLVDNNSTVATDNVQSQEVDTDKEVTTEETIRIKPKDISRLEDPALSRENPKEPALCESTMVEKAGVNIKNEPLDSLYESDSMSGAEVTTGEYVLNPMAKGASRDDCMAEADSTQKFAKLKKRMRRTRTHYRGIKQFKRKCDHCKIHLHSKQSYTQHMERFHAIGKMMPVERKMQPSISTALFETGKLKTQKAKMLMPVRSSARIASEQSLSQLYRDEEDDEDDEDEEEDEEMIEDVEDELMSLEKDSPLTPVQQNIISQLKTYSCYACKQYFLDRRSTLNHIRVHMPDLRPYTCIACLTEFADRAMYKMHCSESFECAMKIALVVPKYGTEKYFTCNMCLRPMPNRQELLTHLQKHSDKQYEQLVSPSMETTSNSTLPRMINGESSTISIPGPYANGDPNHNHSCELCGMIYKRKVNMEKHRNLCQALQPEIRTSYRCVYCGMTYLLFKKFQSHLMTEHRKRDYPCHWCRETFRSPEDYLIHHNRHRGIEEPSVNGSNADDESGQQHNCALCSESFSNRADLTEHRNLHLKVKIYSCVICRSMFSSPGSLEAHMKDHGIQDSNDQSVNSSFASYNRHDSDLVAQMARNSRVKCPDCDKSFSNLQNVKRHANDMHHIKYHTCSLCVLFFKRREDLTDHYRVYHENNAVEASSFSEQTTPYPRRYPKKPLLKCPKCPKTFTYAAYMNQHCISAHGINYNDSGQHECNLCDKKFKEESSLSVHKGWHVRLGTTQSLDSQSTSYQNASAAATSTPKPAKARKSFPKPAVPAKPIQCQVCDDSFPDVTELRKHLWEVHCARAKQEKPFLENELQCELCTNIFQDQQSLEDHMEWHNENPILGGSPPSTPKKTVRCEPCGKIYSSRKMLYKHKKLQHKTPTPINHVQIKGMSICNICGKGFSALGNLRKHHTMVHENNSSQEKFRTKKEFVEVETIRKKPVTCHVCRMVFPSMRVLYQHRQMMHTTHGPGTSQEQPTLIPLSGHQGSVCCNICGKQFPTLPPLKQHFTLKHKTPSQRLSSANQASPRQVSVAPAARPPTLTTARQLAAAAAGLMRTITCPVSSCNKSFPSTEALQNHEANNHTNVLYSCNLCERHYFNKSIMVKHVLNTHKAVCQANGNKDNFYMETDLISYEIEGLRHNRECPRCKVMYPNTKALKIHYFKFHDRGH